MSSSYHDLDHNHDLDLDLDFDFVDDSDQRNIDLELVVTNKRNKNINNDDDGFDDLEDEERKLIDFIDYRNKKESTFNKNIENQNKKKILTNNNNNSSNDNNDNNSNIDNDSSPPLPPRCSFCRVCSFALCCRTTMAVLILATFIIIIMIAWYLDVLDVWIFRQGILYSHPLSMCPSPSCTLRSPSCFDVSRCPVDSRLFRIHIYPSSDSESSESSESAPRTFAPPYPNQLPEPTSYFPIIRDIIKNTPTLYTDDPTLACVFLPDLDTTCTYSHCGGIDSPLIKSRAGYSGDAGQLQVSDAIQHLMYWRALPPSQYATKTQSHDEKKENNNNDDADDVDDAPIVAGAGANHILFDFHDSSSGVFVSDNAILLKSSLSYKSPVYRPTMDISLPLPLFHIRASLSPFYISHTELLSSPPHKRPLLAYFKGRIKRHIRRSLARQHRQHRDDDDRESQGMQFIVIDSREERQTNVYADETRFLKQAVFGLAPQGNGLHSYRILEVMAAGCIPVIIADDYVLPFSSISHANLPLSHIDPPFNDSEVEVDVDEEPDSSSSSSPSPSSSSSSSFSSSSSSGSGSGSGSSSGVDPFSGFPGLDWSSFSVVIPASKVDNTRDILTRLRQQSENSRKTRKRRKQRIRNRRRKKKTRSENTTENNASELDLDNDDGKEEEEEDILLRMQRRAYEVFNLYFKDLETITLTAMRHLKQKVYETAH